MYLIVGAYFCISIDGNYLGFILGAMLYDVYMYKEPDTTYFSKLYSSLIKKSYFIRTIFALGIYLSCIPMQFTSIYKILAVTRINVVVFRTIGLAMVLWGILNIKMLDKILSGRFFQFLGGISFAIYAIHWPLMCSAQAKLFLVLHNVVNYDSAALIAFLINLLIIIIASLVIHNLIEKKIDIYRFCISLKNR